MIKSITKNKIIPKAKLPPKYMKLMNYDKIQKLADDFNDFFITVTSNLSSGR